MFLEKIFKTNQPLIHHELGIEYGELEALKAVVIVLEKYCKAWSITKDIRKKRVVIKFDTLTHVQFECLMQEVVIELAKDVGSPVQCKLIEE